MLVLSISFGELGGGGAKKGACVPSPPPPPGKFVITVEPRYNEVLGTMKITLLYQVSRYIRVKKQRNIKSWDQQITLL